MIPIIFFDGVVVGVSVFVVVSVLVSGAFGIHRHAEHISVSSLQGGLHQSFKAKTLHIILNHNSNHTIFFMKTV